MEFLKNLGRGLLVVGLGLTVVALFLFLIAVVLTFNDWLYYNHNATWPIFWGTTAAGLLVWVVALIGRKNREWTGG